MRDARLCDRYAAHSLTVKSSIKELSFGLPISF